MDPLSAVVALAVAAITGGPAWGAWVSNRKTRRENAAQHADSGLTLRAIRDDVLRLDGKVDAVADDVQALQDWKARQTAPVIRLRGGQQ